MQSTRSLWQWALDHSRVSLRKSQPASESREEKESCWENLPESLLYAIFLLLKDGPEDWAHHQTLRAASSVNRAWRHLGQQTFFCKPWQMPTLICHPLQLFSLRPIEGMAPLPATHAFTPSSSSRHALPPTYLVHPLRPQLLRCFVRRQGRCKSNLQSKEATRFLMFMGGMVDEPQPAGSQFLLAAQPVSRWETLLSLSQSCTGPPIAKLVSNTLGTHYVLYVDKRVESYSETGAASASPRYSLPSPWWLRGKPQAEVKYKTRLQGFMRPRKMKVVLPSAANLPRYGQQAKEGCGCEACVGERRGSFATSREGGRELAARWFGGGRLAGGRPFSSGGAVVDDHAADAETALRGAVLEAPGPSKMETCRVNHRGLRLANKSPHWNEDLRCWCLNFRGRVKLASVKNLQLMSLEDSNKGILLQFGKVEPTTYILDFNPHLISAAQAFAVALSTFDTKVLL